MADNAQNGIQAASIDRAEFAREDNPKRSGDRVIDETAQQGLHHVIGGTASQCVRFEVVRLSPKMQRIAPLGEEF